MPGGRVILDGILNGGEAVERAVDGKGGGEDYKG